MMPAVNHTLMSSSKDSEFRERAEAGSPESGFAALLMPPPASDSRNESAPRYAEPSNNAPTSPAPTDTAQSNPAQTNSAQTNPAQTMPKPTKGEPTKVDASSAQDGEASINKSPPGKEMGAHLSLSVSPNLLSLTATEGSAFKRKSMRLGHTDSGRVGREGSAIAADSRLIEPKSGRLNGMAAASALGTLPAVNLTAADSSTTSIRSAATPLTQTSAGASLSSTVSDGLATAMTETLNGAPRASGGPTTSLTSLSMFHVPVPVGTSDWSNQLGDRVLTALRADLGEAVINLAPEELGPVKVSLVVSDGEVRLQWVASASETRHALEQALPRLREMLAQEGLQLTDSQVSAGGGYENPREFSRDSSGDGLVKSNDSEHESAGSPTISVKSDLIRTGLLDIYI